jgi:glycosyltransferase involved in cell wall biosynthesis
MSVSVALAAYNGEKYIAEQINSVLPELGDDDEIIISDDNPSGKTKQAVLSLGDPRIRYIEGSGSGVVKNFENALNHCRGDYIFLCDQDDVWLPGKVKRVMEEFDKGASLVLHNAEITDKNLVPYGKTCFELYGSNSRFLKNFIRNSFVGCCMAFRREILDFTLPFPDKLPMHDWWIALSVIKRGDKISLIDEPLIYWRRHSGNVTGSPTSLAQKIRFRAIMLSSLIKHR